MTTFSINGPFPSRKAYQVLRDRLIAHLIENGAASGEVLCTEAQLMECSGLSRTTVRKAVDELCQTGWVERRAGVGMFVGPRVEAPVNNPEAAADGSARRSRGRDGSDPVRVAVLLHLQGEGGVDYFTRGVLQGLDSAALEESIAVELVGDSNLDVHTLVRRLKQTQADVLVVMPCTTRHAMLAGVAESMGIRCLIAGTHMFDSGLPTVCEDGEQATAIAVRHLAERGHRRIGLWLSQAPVVWVHQRRNGYLKAMQECGLPVDERLVLWTPCTPVEDTACRTHLAHVEPLDAYLREQQPTALVIGSSGQHTRTLGEWRRRSRTLIPEDLSVIFLDQNYEDYARFLHRRPTIVALPLVEMGRTLARFAKRIRGSEGQAALPPEPHLLPCTVVEGDSVADH